MANNVCHASNIQPQRIMIVGSPGAGKSTLANLLAKVLGIPCYHLDRFYWKPNWQKYTISEWMAIHQQLIEQPVWIIEGCAIKSSFMERFARADLVVYLKISRLVCLWRMAKRCMLPAAPDRPDGCIDGLPWRLIKYMWQFNARLMRPLLVQAQKNNPQTRLVVVRNAQQASILFNELTYQLK